MATGKIDHLIINSPYEEPKLYWKRDERTGEFFKESGRRPAGYVVANPESTSLEDPGRFISIDLVEAIRPRIKRWREAGYPGATGTTIKLLNHWWNIELRREMKRFFFCQLDAIETLIWIVEAPASERTGIEIPNDGGLFRRYCSKMATGSGKTIVMGMLIAWQALNKIADPQNAAYSKNFLIVAPGLTVRQRLQVLKPSDPTNYYDEFAIVPPGLRDKLYQSKVSVINWHLLQWESDEQLRKKKSVDKRGAMSDTAYTRAVLKELGNAENIVVINDEAHHAWRITPDLEAGLSKDDKEEATIWVDGLDRIYNTRGIMTAYDFTATPFISSGRGGTEETLFNWIVSDFGLNDAIESGLVKTPRVVIRDDGALDAQNKSKFYRLYSHVREDLNRRVPETTPLPDLVKTAYTLLGKDWLEHFNEWQARDSETPPVMITVTNRTETAARIKYAFDKKKIIGIDELSEPDKTLHIDSKVLASVEEIEPEPTAASESDSSDEEQDEAPTERKKTKKELALELREMVDTVGKSGRPGALIRNVISVGMLTEGWDARTVTHIMGLRAFTSQLLCEQVVGRGLRRTSYDVSDSGLFEPEYVNIFGIPFTFMPHEDTGDAPPKPTKPKFTVEPIAERREFEITFPNVLRVEQVFKPRLELDIEQAPTLTLNAFDTPTIAELAPVIEGKPDISRISEISLQELGEKYRTQRIVFETAISVYEQMQADWKGNKEYLLGQVISQVERFINSDKIQITPPLFYQDELRRRLIITLNLSKVGGHIKGIIRNANTESLELVVDSDHPLCSTADMLTWYTSRPWEYTRKSQINRVVFDARWEATEAYELERNENVIAWAKNDHLGFLVNYSYQGTPHTYYPDYLVRLSNGVTLVLEVKGQDSQQNRTKREYLDEWVRAVNAHGGFGQWAWAVSMNPADLPETLERLVQTKNRSML
jgi:type III restriction enzyme